MEKKKWPWKRKSSERSLGESESLGSFSSHSERYSDEQDASRDSPNDSTQSPEITSKASIINDELNDRVKTLTEKLSAALVNVSAKEDLVKQHAKVAEEAVAGWEKAENEVGTLKQQLEVAVQQNLNLEARVSHLDGALKECVRQLRQARDEHEERISDAIEAKNCEWELAKVELEKQIVELQAEAAAAKAENSSSIDKKSLLILQKLEKENSLLKQELVSQYKELEILTIERDLSTQAAEAARKLQLESIKKVAKLEAECRRLQTVARKSSPVNNSKSVAASYCYAESLPDSHSDGGERPNVVETNGSELSCSDSWASALIAELDHFKNGKPLSKSRAACSFEIDMMDDFLEMERLAALPETKSNTPFTESASGESVSMDNPLRAELDLMTQRVAELEKMLEKLEAEKIELQTALDESRGSLKAAESRTVEAEADLEKLRKELATVNEAKESLEFQVIGMEIEARTISANVDSLKAEIEKEQTLSAELKAKCQELENELSKTARETEIQENTKANDEPKLKQEDIAVAANKLAECQKTIASLGQQLKSLATLEDFLIDTSKIPGFSKGPLVSDTGSEIWKLHSNDTFSDSDRSGTSTDKGTHLENRNSEESLAPYSLTTSSANQVTAAKYKNGFGKFFSRSKGVLELNNCQE